MEAKQRFVEAARRCERREVEAWRRQVNRAGLGVTRPASSRRLVAEWIAKAALGSGLFSALFVAATLLLYGMRERLVSDAWVDVRQAVQLFFPVYLLATLTAIFLGLIAAREPTHRRRGIVAVALGVGSMIGVVVGRSLLA